MSIGCVWLGWVAVRRIIGTEAIAHPAVPPHPFTEKFIPLIGACALIAIGAFVLRKPESCYRWSAKQFPGYEGSGREGRNAKIVVRVFGLMFVIAGLDMFWVAVNCFIHGCR